MSFKMSVEWELVDVLNDVLGSCGVTGWDKKLGESNLLWWSPFFGLPKFPLFGLLVNEVIEDRFFVNGHFLS
mgnify:CR=1 FL=1